MYYINFMTHFIGRLFVEETKENVYIKEFEANLWYIFSNTFALF